MDVGYLPDMFGHVAQMPQLLRLAGLRARGRVARRARRGRADRVLVGGARRLARARRVPLRLVLERPRHPRRRQAPRRCAPATTSTSSARRACGDMLLMNGTDHQMPQPWLGRVVAEANAVQDDYEFVVTSLPEYLADQPTDGLVTVHRRAALGRAGEPAHGRRVEPRRRAPGVRGAPSGRSRSGPSRCPRCSCPPSEYPHALADIAWRKLVLNSAHDSSCACSSDEVVDQVLVRYDEARQIGDGLTRDAVRALAAQVDAPARRDASSRTRPPAARSGLVDARVPGTGPCHFVGPDGVAHAGAAASATTATRASRRWSPARRCAGCSTSCAAPSSPGARSTRTR